MKFNVINFNNKVKIGKKKKINENNDIIKG